MKRRDAWLIAAIAIGAWASVTAQVPVPKDNDNITPVYEGWLPNDDGSFDLVFGYMNREWESETSIPLGAANTMDPGGPDQGQPTNFFPRRNRFVFKVHVPKDFGTKEIVWTLTSKGRTEKAYGTLKNDYVLDDTVIMSNIGAGGALSTTPDMVGNKAPADEFKSPAETYVKQAEPYGHEITVGANLDLARMLTREDDLPRAKLANLSALVAQLPSVQVPQSSTQPTVTHATPPVTHTTTGASGARP